MTDRGPGLVPDVRVEALRALTPEGWAEVAIADLHATMSDHAHAEKKAALSAMALVTRAPGRTELVRHMPRLAREELRHLDQVLAHLRHRGWPLLPDRPDRYAGALLALRRRGGTEEAALCDQLLVAALIEARSWERLRLLGNALQHAGADASAATDAVLGAFYDELARSEAGHYRLFVDLALAECPGQDVGVRLDELAAAEADIILALPHEARIH